MYFFWLEKVFFLLYRACLVCFLLTKRIMVLVLPILESFLPILWQASISLLSTLTLMSVRISVTESSNWLLSTLSGMPLIIILFLLPYCFRLLVEYSNSTSFCSNLLHLSLKITFLSCNRLIITAFRLLISSLGSVLTELMKLVIFCSKFTRASWKPPFLGLVLYSCGEIMIT